MSPAQTRVLTGSARPAEPFEAALEPLIEPGLQLAFAVLRDRHLAEDAVQEAACKAWRSWHHYRDHGRGVRPWFLKIVLNQCRSMLRTPWWRLRRTTEEAGDQLVEPTPEQLHVDRIDLERAIQGLDQGQRAAVYLHYVMDLPHAEVAEVLGIRAGTVKSRLHRAVARLRRELGAEEAEQ